MVKKIRLLNHFLFIIQLGNVFNFFYQIKVITYIFLFLIYHE